MERGGLVGLVLRITLYQGISHWRRIYLFNFLLAFLVVVVLNRLAGAGLVALVVDDARALYQHYLASPLLPWSCSSGVVWPLPQPLLSES